MYEIYPLNLYWLQERIHFPTVFFKIESFHSHEAFKLGHIISYTVKPVAVITCTEHKPRGVHPFLVTSLLPLQSPERFEKVFHTLITSLNVSLQSSTFKRPLTSVVTTQRFKIEVVPNMYHNIRLLVHNVLPNPPHIIEVNSGFTLSVPDY